MKPQMLIRSDPFRDLDRLALQLQGAGSPGIVLMDAYRQGDQFVVNLDLPGLHPASIDVVVEENVVTVKAERYLPRREGHDVLAAERPRGTFTSQLFLADTLDADNIEAQYDKGVLTLTIPVRQEASSRRVQLTTGSDRGTAIEASTAV